MGKIEIGIISWFTGFKAEPNLLIDNVAMSFYDGYTNAIIYEDHVKK